MTIGKNTSKTILARFLNVFEIGFSWSIINYRLLKLVMQLIYFDNVL